MRSVILIMLGMIVWACGSRKTEVQIEKNEKKTESLKTEQKDVVTMASVETHILSNIDEFVISPIDNEKEVVVIQPGKDTLKFRNARIERKKSIHNIEQKEDAKQTDNSTVRIKESEEIKDFNKHKTSERNYSWLFLFFLIPLYFLLRWAYRKVRKRAS